MWHDTVKPTKRNSLNHSSGFPGNVPLEWLSAALLVLVLSALPGPAKTVASPPDEVPVELSYVREPAGTAPGFYVIAVSPDGQHLAVRDRENVLFMFNWQEQKKRFRFKGHETNWIEMIQFSPDGQNFLTAAGSGEKLKIWRSDNGELELELPTTTTSAYFSNQGDLIAALGSSHVEFFAWPDGINKGLAAWKLNQELPAAMSMDANLVVMYRQARNSLNPQVFQFELLNRQNRLRIALPGDTARATQFVFSPDRRWIAGSFQDSNRLHIWSTSDPMNGHYILDEHVGILTTMAFSHDSRFLISCDDLQQLVVWDVLTKQSITRFKSGQTTVRALACLPRAYRLAVAGSTNTDSSIWVADMLPVILKPNQTRPDSLQPLWHQLGSTDVETSLNATSAMIENFEVFFDELQETVNGATFDRSADELQILLDELGNARFARRELATRQLMERLSHYENALRDFYQQQPMSPELRSRIRRILLNRPARPRVNVRIVRRWMRLILVCESTASPQARQLLQRIATGHADPEISGSASDALKRLTN